MYHTLYKQLCTPLPPINSHYSTQYTRSRKNETRRLTPRGSRRGTENMSYRLVFSDYSIVTRPRLLFERVLCIRYNVIIMVLHISLSGHGWKIQSTDHPQALSKAGPNTKGIR